MKKIVIGILAHVDAGKTTLSESMLYLSGKIRKLGRVDHKDAYLDTYALEKQRGITIFSKQARFEYQDLQITLLDTPGHIDFSAEMERTLQVLDYAILVISARDGIQGHTLTLWELLKHYQIPVFIFVNKMDQEGADVETIQNALTSQLSEHCLDFTLQQKDTLWENIALCDEALMTTYLETEQLTPNAIQNGIINRKIFPCYYGSALKLEGIDTFLEGLALYSKTPHYPEAFGAKIFKISRDAQGNRLTHLKITGGTLQVKTTIFENEKINQIRLYSGEKFETAEAVNAGTICAVTGLSSTFPGQALGDTPPSKAPVLIPVLTYQVCFKEGYDPKALLPKLKQLEEELPELHLVWQEKWQALHVQVMGDVQLEILQMLIKERFDLDVHFDSGQILYKETIKTSIEGVGHFEPLRHYAEVHILLEPGAPNSGMTYETDCKEEVLDKNWQRLILTHLKEKVHCGVLTGAPLTDLKFTLVSGKAHPKHTQGGDFREATYRAVRQGLMLAESILLEPYYQFKLKIPEKMVGRAMHDLDTMYATCQIEQAEGGFVTLTGTGPVVTLRYYAQEVLGYTSGQGKLFCQVQGYAPCHNADEICQKAAYDPLRDLENPTGSVFCQHGEGFLVPWDEVHQYMHIPLGQTAQMEASLQNTSHLHTRAEETFVGVEEIDAILQKTYFSNQGNRGKWKKKSAVIESYAPKQRKAYFESQKREEYLLVDGYNIIFAWPELEALAKTNMDGAKINLLEALCNYQGYKKCEIIVVFDAYRVKGHQTESFMYHQLTVVYTKEAETADRYIEKFAHQNHEKYQITVATSDGLEQIIIRGNDCRLLSARELKNEITYVHEQALEAYQASQAHQASSLEEHLTPELQSKLKGINELKE